ncbi:hypothetical protein ACFW04_006621 [Cataglyphis niger]
MSECKSVRTSMETDFVNDCQNDLNINKPYHELVGCLMYLTIKKILRYIQGTLNYGLIYCKSKRVIREPLTGFVDADWESAEDRKSTSGFVQNTVAQFSMEAEFVALTTCATEYLWLRNLMNNLELKIKWEHKRLKYIDIKYNFVKDLLTNKQIEVKYIRTDEQTADTMTKSLKAIAR